MRSRVAAALLVTFLSGAAVNAQAPAPVAPPATRLRLAMLLGWERWPAVGDLNPPPVLPGAPVVGGIRADGFDFDMTAHWTVRHAPGRELLVGVEGGVFFHENTSSFEGIFQPDGSTESGRVDLRGLYLGPAVRIVWTGHRKVHPLLGVLVGAYLVDAAVLYDSGFEGEEYPDKTALGVQLTGGLEILPGKVPGPFSVRLEARVRFTGLGQLPAFGPDGGSMSGPAYALLIGGAYHL